MNCLPFLHLSPYIRRDQLWPQIIGKTHALLCQRQVVLIVGNTDKTFAHPLCQDRKIFQSPAFKLPFISFHIQSRTDQKMADQIAPFHFFFGQQNSVGDSGKIRCMFKRFDLPQAFLFGYGLGRTKMQISQIASSSASQRQGRPKAAFLKRSFLFAPHKPAHGVLPETFAS